jgi:hypothetical protein
VRAQFFKDQKTQHNPYPCFVFSHHTFEAESLSLQTGLLDGFLTYFLNLYLGKWVSCALLKRALPKWYLLWFFFTPCGALRLHHPKTSWSLCFHHTVLFSSCQGMSCAGRDTLEISLGDGLLHSCIDWRFWAKWPLKVCMSSFVYHQSCNTIWWAMKQDRVAKISHHVVAISGVACFLRCFGTFAPQKSWS